MAHELTDAKLLHESRRRPEAFVEVSRRHVDVLLAWVTREAGDADVAAELVAETLAEAWRVRRRFRDPGDGSARPWLFGIARNLLNRYCRRGAVDARARARIGLRLDTPTDPFEAVDQRLMAEAERPRVAAGRRLVNAHPEIDLYHRQTQTVSFERAALSCS